MSCIQPVSYICVAGKHGWPTSAVLPAAPETEEEQATLIDTLQDWKTQHYQDIIGARPASSRPCIWLRAARQLLIILSGDPAQDTLGSVKDASAWGTAKWCIVQGERHVKQVALTLSMVRPRVEQLVERCRRARVCCG